MPIFSNLLLVLLLIVVQIQCSGYSVNLVRERIEQLAALWVKPCK